MNFHRRLVRSLGFVTLLMMAVLAVQFGLLNHRLEEQLQASARQLSRAHEERYREPLQKVETRARWAWTWRESEMRWLGAELASVPRWTFWHDGQEAICERHGETVEYSVRKGPPPEGREGWQINFPLAHYRRTTPLGLVTFTVNLENLLQEDDFLQADDGRTLSRGPLPAGWRSVTRIADLPLSCGVVLPRPTVNWAPLAGLGLGGGVVVWLWCYHAAAAASRPLEQLARSVKGWQPGTAEIPHLEKTLRAHEAELKLALQIQTSGQPPQLTMLATPQLRAAGLSQPAREVGGDFYDGFLTDRGTYVAMVGDVAGKGVPSALYTVVTRLALKEALKKGEGPRAALEQANRLLCLDATELFVTAVAVEVDPATGRGTAARAGHPAPLTRQGELDLPALPPLGLSAEMEYEETPFQLDGPLLLYSDGLSEAHSPQRELLGEERLAAHFAALPWDGPAALVEALASWVGCWRDGAPANDDLTLVVLAP